MLFGLVKTVVFAGVTFLLLLYRKRIQIVQENYNELSQEHQNLKEKYTELSNSMKLLQEKFDSSKFQNSLATNEPFNGIPVLKTRRQPTRPWHPNPIFDMDGRVKRRMLL